MIMTYNPGKSRYEIRTTYQEYQEHGHKIKAARFRFEKHPTPLWWTDSEDNAARLASCADPAAKDRLAGLAERQQTALAASRADDADIEIPCPPGLAYRPFQRAGIAYAIRRPRTLNADDMGLGKTIQAAGQINAVPDINTVLIVCPATLKSNWKRELDKWLVRKRKIQVVFGSDAIDPQAQIVIVNYDIVHRQAEAYRARTWDLLVCDECHFMKSGKKARRGRYVLGGALFRTNERTGKKEKTEEVSAIPSRYSLFLSGTPLTNRPKELYALLAYLDPGRWRNFMYFAKRYCAAFQDEVYKPGGRGAKMLVWNFNGSSNEEELQRILRETIMVRRSKEDVLAELPPLTRQMIVIDPNTEQRRIIAKERAAFEPHRERWEALQAEAEFAQANEDEAAYKAAIASLTQLENIAFTEMSAVRRELGIAKVPNIIEHVEDLLETVDKVTIMVHHHEVVDRLMEAFAAHGAVRLTGLDSPAQKDAAIQAFQHGPARVFVGSILAAGVGITLTASSLVVFGEQDWTPGNMDQAADRLHRIGQQDNVLAQYLVLDGSLDAKLSHTLAAKEEVISAILDKPTLDFTVPYSDPAAPKLRKDGTPRKEPQFSDEVKTAMLACLQMLAGMDPDHARFRNDIGFNAFDNRFGHILAGQAFLTDRQAMFAKKILKKYHRQLPRHLFGIVFPDFYEEDKVADTASPAVTP